MGSQRPPNRLRGWLPLLTLPALVLLLTPAAAPRWLLMWLLAVAIYAGCKWLTWRRTPAPAAPGWRHLGYLLAWPGLDADAFLHGRPSSPPRPGEWACAAAKLLFGIVLLWGVVRLVPAEWPLLRDWAGMAGIVFVLHFGTLHLLSCAWRALGVDAKPLMNVPIAAESVGDFWGRRWNTAFRDLAHRFLFRPFTRRLGPAWGVVAGFAFSGLAHDLVISVPAGGGYGLPTLYFALQAPAVLLEHSRTGRALGLGRGLTGRLFALLVLVLPAPALFHPPFLHNVILPFLRAVGAC